MDIYRIEKKKALPWLYKAYDYVRMDSFVFGQDIPLEIEFGRNESIDELEGIVIVDNHKPIAGCRITYPKEGVGKIERVCVIRDKQRSGVGYTLIAEAEKWIRERKVKHIVIDSQDRAVVFYEKCGYKIIDGVNPEIYENNSHTEQNLNAEKKEKPKNNLGFSCVLVEKYLS